MKTKQEEGASTFLCGGHLTDTCALANGYFGYAAYKSTSLKLALRCLSTGFCLIYKDAKNHCLLCHGGLCS